MTGVNWGLKREKYQAPWMDDDLINTDTETVHWELWHTLHETNHLASPEHYTTALSPRLSKYDWSYELAINDTGEMVKPYIRIFDDMFNIKEIESTATLQNRYYKQISWLYLHTYTRFHTPHEYGKNT